MVTEIRDGVHPDKKTLREFHDCLFEEYQELLSGERNVLFKMKELWGYLIHSCPEEEKLMKKIRKAQHLAEYEGVVSELFCRMREHE